MHKKVKCVMSRILILAMAAATIGTGTPDSEAAKKPKLSKSSIKVAIKKSKKINIKNVKKSTVRKLTVKPAKKSVASVKKNGKTAFTVTGKKKGSTNVTAKVTLKGKKKAVSLKLKVTVTGDDKRTDVPSVTSAPTAVPGTTSPQNPAPGTDTTEEPATESPSVPTVTPLTNYSEDFENGLGEWFARGNQSKLMISEEAHSGNGAALIYDRQGDDNLGHSWNGPAMDLTDCITPGGKYKVSFWAKIPSEDTAYKRGINLRVSSAKYYSKEDMDNGEEPSCENYPADTNYPISLDEWTQIEVEFTVPEYFYNFVFYIETNGYGKARFLIDDFTMQRISAPAEYDASLTSIKEAYAPYIPTVGVAVSYSSLMNQNTLGFIKHHFNSITLGNEMKLDSMMSTKKTLKLTDAAAAGYVVDEAYKACVDNKDADGDVVVPEINFSNMDNILKIAKENGLKVRVHSPFWHQQNPQFFFTKGYADNSEEYTDAETMYTREEMYVRTLLEHIFNSGYGDVVSAYDVVNEYLNMKNEGETYVNYWKYIFGTEVDTNSPYVKKAFVVAHDELVKNNRTDIALIYNDYNTYLRPQKVVELINNINAQDAMNPDGTKVCNGIGMQSHINGQKDEDKFEDALIAFREAGFEIQITELDVTNTGTVTSTTSAETKQTVWEKNAETYGKLMEAVLRQKAAGANITSLTIWGTTDATSWRAEKAPLLFGESVADKKPSFDAVINAALNFGK
ncbi:MAG: endo-1,4-beta-xylanase [Roseburia sp.]|nr:endo-1,4-beta-xylanase [Roseburia sp.]